MPHNFDIHLQGEIREANEDGRRYARVNRWLTPKPAADTGRVPVFDSELRPRRLFSFRTRVALVRITVLPILFGRIRVFLPTSQIQALHDWTGRLLADAAAREAAEREGAAFGDGTDDDAEDD